MCSSVQNIIRAVPKPAIAWSSSGPIDHWLHWAYPVNNLSRLTTDYVIYGTPSAMNPALSSVLPAIR